MKRSTFTLGLVVALCVGVATLGTLALFQYENESGPAARPPLRLPSSSNIARASDRDTLLVFVHPQCPCTRATISELSKLMTRHRADLATYVIVFAPATKPSDWNRSDIVDATRAIPGVTVVEDFQGAEANRFRVSTSGQTLLYDTAGHLTFSGGITGARGQEGDNPGLHSLISVIDNHSTLNKTVQKIDTPTKNSIKTSRVFGCLIQHQKHLQERDGGLCLN